MAITVLAKLGVFFEHGKTASYSANLAEKIKNEEEMGTKWVQI